MDDDNTIKASLRADDKGNRFCITNKKPQCRRCGDLMQEGDAVYFCSASKNVYCSKCMHSKVYWSCPNPNLVEEHIDWFSILKVEEKIKYD